MEGSIMNPWKLTTMAVLLVLATALATGLVVANWAPSQTRAPTDAPRSHFAGNWAAAQPGGPAGAPVNSEASAAPAAQPRPAPTVPTRADTVACNRYASAHAGQRDKTWEVAKDALIGGGATAGVGAAAGAIAGGGSGAGKGAAIGGLVGAAGGALYGINENRQADAGYRAAYAGCMRSRGFAG